MAGCCAPGTAGREEDRARVLPGSRGSSGALGARGGGGGRGPPSREGGAERARGGRDGAPQPGAVGDWRSGEPGAPGGARRDRGQAARGSTSAPRDARACGEGAPVRESGAVLFAGFQATEKRFFPLCSIFAIV